MKDIMYNTKEVLEKIIFCREKSKWKRTRSKYKLSDYDILDSVRIYNELLIKNQALTINTNVANFYKSLGFTVMLDDESINYIIRKGIDTK